MTAFWAIFVGGGVGAGFAAVTAGMKATAVLT